MELLRALRPHQWTKNLVVLAGPVFALRLLDPEALARTVVVFVLFCLASSAVYLFNDVRDREADRLHPIKRDRPLARGTVAVTTAIAVAAVFATITLTAAWILGPWQLTVLFATYLTMQVAYTLRLKHVPILDALIVATGFVLRAVAGAVAIAVAISTWLLICTIFFALFVSLAKRRHEVAQLAEAAAGHRASLAGYDLDLLDQLVGIATAASLMSYALYTTDSANAARFGTPLLPLTIPFVIYAFFRLLYLMRTSAELGDPAMALVRDRALQVSALLWAISLWLILY